MPESLRVNRVCPIKRSAPALCHDCAIAIRVLDEAGLNDLRKKGVKEPEAYAYDCPLRMPALYGGQLVKLMDSLVVQVSAVADALENGAAIATKGKKGAKKEAKKETKKETKKSAGKAASRLSTVGEDGDDDLED